MATTTVEEYMATPVLTVERAATVEAVADAMLQRGNKSIVCIEADCEPAGILTSTDFVAMAASHGVETTGTVGEPFSLSGTVSTKLRERRGSFRRRPESLEARIPKS